MDQKKLLCLAFDPVRGGAPLPDLEAECPAHLQHAVFGLPTAKRSIIAWHRVKDVCTRSHYSTRPTSIPTVTVLLTIQITRTSKTTAHNHSQSPGPQTLPYRPHSSSSSLSSY